MGVNFPSPINNNYNNASSVNLTNAPSPTTQSRHTQQEQVPQENSAPENQNTKSEYKGKEIKNSKFDPTSGNIDFFSPKENALVALVAAGAAIVTSLSGGNYDEKNFKPMTDTINSTQKKLGELGTSAQISPFGSISESESEKFRKMTDKKKV